MQKLNRTCWWCISKLMKISHAEVRGPNGIVWVHKCCESEARNYFKQITARETDTEHAAVYHGDIDGDYNY